MEFLDKIIAHQEISVAQRQEQVSQAELEKQIAQTKANTRGFAKSLWLSEPIGIIAEMKKASPSAGVLQENYDPLAIAKSYKEGGASCLSILTNEFFQGTTEHLMSVRSKTDLPILRKDFIIDVYQVYETKAMRADAMLLIAACLEDNLLLKLAKLALRQGLDILLEVHSMAEAKRVMDMTRELDRLLSPNGKAESFDNTKDDNREDKRDIDAASSTRNIAPNIDKNIAHDIDRGAILIGVNNRNLHSFETDIRVGAKVLEYLAENCDYLLVAESGIRNTDDISFLMKAGAKSFLIGEHFMRSDNPAASLQEITIHQ